MTGRIFSIIMAIVAVFSAKAATMELGYCGGEASGEATGKVGNCTVSAGIILTPDVLAPYRGARITGVRLYLTAPEGISGLEGWVRGSLDGENLDSSEAATFGAGWQTIPMSGVLTVGDEPLAVGFSFSQPKTVKCISLGGDANDNGRYIAKNGKWEKIQSTIAGGSVCIELVISGDVIPGKDLELKSLHAQFPLVEKGKDIVVTASLINSSLSAIDGFSYEFNISGEILRGTSPLHIAPKGKGELELTLPTASLPVDTPLKGVLTVSAEGDGNPLNNSAEIGLGCYSEAYPRMLLLEEFTTEQCVNCPRAINTIKQAMEAGYSDRVAVVAHHVGYDTDWLTLEEDKSLLWLYGEDGTFAPAVMLDRTVRNPSVHYPVESIAYFDTFGPRLDEAFLHPAFATVTVVPRYSDDEITVRVEARAHPLFNVLTAEPCLTVILTEDGIVHLDQAGISNPDFTHSHVTRAYLTPVEGQPFVWDGDTFVWEGSAPKNSVWDVKNAEVVAFISHYNRLDATDCRVYNTAKSRIAEAAVEAVSPEGEAVAVEYFDLQGRKTVNPEAGIYIVRKTFADGAVSVSKVVL